LQLRGLLWVDAVEKVGDTSAARNNRIMGAAFLQITIDRLNLLADMSPKMGFSF
jgi:hypothetical protein